MDDKRLKQLVQRYLDGMCTSEDLAVLQEKLSDPACRQQLEMLYGDAWEESVTGAPKQDERRAQAILHRILTHDHPRKFWRWSRPYAAVAAVLLLGIASFLFIPSGSLDRRERSVAVSPLDADPGTYRAELSYGGSAPVALRAAEGGIVMKDDRVIYPDGTDLQIDRPEGSADHHYYELRTPRGGSYRVTLPDGTNVWLNAETTLRYPARFSADARTVILAGEAYFEVAKRRGSHKGGIPFSVITDRQRIQVLGTEFNVKAYADESYTTTTLVEGRVRVDRPVSGNSVGQGLVLSPGQEALAGKADSRLITREADMHVAAAWKEGLFVFNDETLGSLMQRLSRWYDVEVLYRGGAEDIRFTGNYAMNKSLRSLLEHITLTEGIRFEMAGNSANERRIIAIKD